jgi:hypothetical protein
MVASPPVVAQFCQRLAALGWVSDLHVAGSLACGDYVPGVSDLDLVAVIDGPVDAQRATKLTEMHRRIDQHDGPDRNLGCVYVDTIADPSVKHWTWTHGVRLRRILSQVTRAELVRHGYALFGRPPHDVFPPVSAADVRAATRAELTGYWTWAARRPWVWRNPVMIDLGLTSMARGRHALRTGTLLTKSQAIEQADAPAWLVDQLRARRRGEGVTSPRVRAALIAWRDARRTTRAARR